MTALALAHALKTIAVPAGRTLWLYGDPKHARDDIYTPWYDAAHKSGLDATHFHSDIKTLAPHYEAVIISSPKQQEEAEGLLALALQRSNGFVMAVAAKNAGGSRLASMMEAYGVAFETLSKDSCRVVWTFNACEARRDLIAKNITNLDLIQVTINDEAWWSAPGLFGWNKIDIGSQLLLQHLPADLHGHVADFGCGYGYIAVTLSRRYPKIKMIDAYDIHAQAVAATARNGDEKIQTIWMDVNMLPGQRQYDAVVMNPPFHSGKKEDIALGESFIRAAWNSLKRGGRLFFVANRHLPYEKIIPDLGSLYEGGGFKIIAGTRP
jgi:16S rRNA (guanine1207-N2)-methyltransferase